MNCLTSLSQGVVCLGWETVFLGSQPELVSFNLLSPQFYCLGNHKKNCSWKSKIPLLKTCLQELGFQSLLPSIYSPGSIWLGLCGPFVCVRAHSCLSWQRPCRRLAVCGRVPLPWCLALLLYWQLFLIGNQGRGSRMILPVAAVWGSRAPGIAAVSAHYPILTVGVG